jgi:Ran GTPase-activating protein (RanGAP) involved in mRNA processing and transport
MQIFPTSNYTTSTMLKSIGGLFPSKPSGDTATSYSSTLLEEISSTSSTLQILQLSSKSLNDDHIKCLCEALIRNKTVEQVYLSKNRITDVGAKYVGHMLKFNRRVRVISLEGNEIGPKVSK